MNKRDYPLSLSKDIEKLIKDFRKFQFQNSDIITSIDDANFFIHLVDKYDSRFYFKVSNPNQSNDFRSFFSFYYFPESDKSFQKTSFNNEAIELFKHLNNWVKLLREYNSINYSEQDQFAKQYEDEFYAEFDILEEDAEINPFEHNRQVFIYNLLSYVERELIKSAEQDQEILSLISETQELKENIQNLSKKNLIRKLSRVFAKIKKKGLKLFIDIIDVAKKEIIKKALYGGYYEMNHFIDNIF